MVPLLMKFSSWIGIVVSSWPPVSLVEEVLMIEMASSVSVCSLIDLSKVISIVGVKNTSEPIAGWVVITWGAISSSMSSNTNAFDSAVLPPVSVARTWTMLEVFIAVI